MRVFILQKSNKYDVSAAEAYGKIVYLIDDYLAPFHPDETIQHIRYELDQTNFDPAEDAIALTGASILVSMFLSVLTYDYGRIKTLLFDARTGKYKLVTIELQSKQKVKSHEEEKERKQHQQKESTKLKKEHNDL